MASSAETPVQENLKSFFGTIKNNLPKTIGGDGPPAASDVLRAAEELMNSSTGYFSPIDESKFADDFIFRGPIIGPLNKADYKEVLDYFQVYQAIPDISPNCFGFSVDPENPYRVWFFVRSTGTCENSLGGALGSIAQPKGQVYRGNTEAWSLTFNDDLQARLITAGYVADRFERDVTSQGKGLTFGILATLGVPQPSNPGNPIGILIQKFANLSGGLFPKAYSSAENVPKWWTDSRMGQEE